MYMHIYIYILVLTRAYPCTVFILTLLTFEFYASTNGFSDIAIFLSCMGAASSKGVMLLSFLKLCILFNV